MLGEGGQEAVFFLDAGHVVVGAGQADGQLVAKPEGPVVPALMGNRSNREIGPFGELVADQSTDEVDGDVCHGRPFCMSIQAPSSELPNDASVGMVTYRQRSARASTYRWRT